MGGGGHIRSTRTTGAKPVALLSATGQAIRWIRSSGKWWRSVLFRPAPNAMDGVVEGEAFLDQREYQAIGGHAARL